MAVTDHPEPGKNFQNLFKISVNIFKLLLFHKTLTK